MLYSKFITCNCDFSKFWCRLIEEFPTLSKRAFEVIIPGVEWTTQQQEPP